MAIRPIPHFLITCMLLTASAVPLHAGVREKLIRSVMFGDAVKAREALSAGANANTVDSSGTPLFLLLKYTGNTNVAAILLSNHADWKVRDRNGCDMLHFAAEFGYTDLTRMLFDLGLSPDRPCLTGETALHRAAKAGRYATAKLLVERGAKTDIEDKEKKTPLFAALKAEQLDVAALLLYADLHFGTTNTNTFNAIDTILLKAAKEGKKSIVKFLVDQKMPLTARDDKGRGALYLSVVENHPDISLLLLTGGADADAAAEGGWTSLHAAAWKAASAIPLLLSNRSSSTNRLTDKGVEGFTPLHVAAWKGNLVSASNLTLITNDIDLTDAAGRPAIWHAVTRGDSGMTALLLSRGAKFNVSDTNRLTLMDLASNRLKSGGKKAKETWTLLSRYAAASSTNAVGTNSATGGRK